MPGYCCGSWGGVGGRHRQDRSRDIRGVSEVAEDARGVKVVCDPIDCREVTKDKAQSER